MNWARSVISASTSSCLSGGSLTVVIWVTTPLLACISAMAQVLLIHGRQRRRRPAVSRLFEQLGQRAGRPAELVPEERQGVGGAVDLFRQRIAEAVARARLDLDVDLRLRRLALD